MPLVLISMTFSGRRSHRPGRRDLPAQRRLPVSDREASGRLSRAISRRSSPASDGPGDGLSGSYTALTVNCSQHSDAPMHQRPAIFRGRGKGLNGGLPPLAFKFGLWQRAAASLNHGENLLRRNRLPSLCRSDAPFQGDELLPQFRR